MGGFWGMMGWKEGNFGEERKERRKNRHGINRVRMVLGSKLSHYDDLVLKGS